jgi:hypothetical protein
LDGTDARRPNTGQAIPTAPVLSAGDPLIAFRQYAGYLDVYVIAGTPPPAINDTDLLRIGKTVYFARAGEFNRFSCKPRSHSAKQLTQQ